MSVFMHRAQEPLIPRASTTDPMSIWEEVERPANGTRPETPAKQEPPPQKTEPSQKKS